MATATKQKNTQYVVVADALNLTTGKNQKGEPEVTRMKRGQILNAPADLDTVQELLASKALVLATEENLAKVAAGRRLTARASSRAQGGEDDPVEAPVEDVLPLPAPIPTSAL